MVKWPFILFIYDFEIPEILYFDKSCVHLGKSSSSWPRYSTVLYLVYTC